MVIFLHETEAGEITGQSIPLEGRDNDGEENTQLRNHGDCRVGKQAAQFAVENRAQTKTEEESCQHQTEGINAVTGDNSQHMHIDDFQREADYTTNGDQQQGSESETAALLSVLQWQGGITVFFIRIFGRRGC